MFFHLEACLRAAIVSSPLKSCRTVPVLEASLLLNLLTDKIPDNAVLPLRVRAI